MQAEPGRPDRPRPLNRALRPRRLVSLGSILIDLVLRIPALPPRGGDVLASHAFIAVGGGFNVVSTAIRLGLPTAYGGLHGVGPFGDRVRDALSGEGAAVLQPATDGADTGYTVALVDAAAERTFVTAPGAEARLDEDDLAKLSYRPDDAIYVSGYDLAYPESGPALARHIGVLPPEPMLVLDPGPLGANVPAARLDAVLSRVQVLSLNAREAGELGGVAALRIRLPPTAVLIVRDGPRGASVLVPGEPLVQVEAPAVKAIDFSGAGDVHVGATLAGLGQGLEWVAAVELANRAAAYSVTHPGPGPGPTREELREFSSGAR
jgi:ribokinase